MVTFDRLWETMERKGITQYRLIKYYGFSAGQLNRLKNNSYVSTPVSYTHLTLPTKA